MSLDEQSIRELIIADFLVHEVGHNLGLRHNFEGSADNANFDVIDEAVATATTTMDYVVGMTVPGSYDREAMRYGYGDGALDTDYRYCTDEDVELIGPCARWDFGNPVTFFFGALDELAEEYPPGTSGNEIDGAANQGEWYLVFTRLRQTLNSYVEAWDPEAPTPVFEAMLERVICAEPCELNVWFRQQYALYLLYSKHAVAGEWYDFPMLDEVQRTTLFGAYEQLLMDETNPQALMVTIVEKLPTSAVPGADDFLDELDEMLQAIEEPTEHEAWLASLVSENND